MSNENYRSLSSAAWEASASFSVAEINLVSDRSKSSSISWILLFKAATSPSACFNEEKNIVNKLSGIAGKEGGGRMIHFEKEKMKCLY